MAENKINRKSKRNFSLEKPIERHFDIEKDETPIAANEPTSQPQKTVTHVDGNDGGNGKNGSKKWIAIALIIVALAGCCYFFMNGNKAEEATVLDKPQVEQNDSTQVGANGETDSLTNENGEGVSGENAIGESEGVDQNEPSNNDEASSDQSTPITKDQSLNDKGSPAAEPSVDASNSSVEQKAKDVWKGVYGNNPDRRKMLGSDYEAVQKRVNEMYRKGQVYY